jgi:predicted nucleotidyltransferase
VPHLDDTVLKGLQAALASSGLVRLAVLFGSRAAGTARPASDFDIGIWPRDPELSLQAELALASELSGVVGAEVDLVRLDRDDPVLGREVACRGVCSFEQAPGGFSAYRARALSTWLDFEETIAPHRERFLKRVASR